MAIESDLPRPAIPDAAMVGDALSELVLAGRYCHPDDLPALIAQCGGRLGATDVVVYVADIGQRTLVALYGRNEPDRPTLSIEATVAGRAFRTESIVIGPAREDGSVQLWAPVQDSAERVGVVTMTFAAYSDSVDRAACAFASLCGEYVVAKSRYSDALERTRRLQPLTLAAEMQWALLPPLTYHSPSTTISGLLEPAYGIAGDTFDYAILGNTAHLAIFDAVGHGLTASRVANLAVSSYRNSRRGGGGLEQVYRDIDDVIAMEFGESMFVTGALATLDITDGRLRWLNAGHPSPLLVRGARVVEELGSTPSLPCGLGGDVAGIAEQRLQHGDSVILFTDGVVEARSPTGELFGIDRLNDHIARAGAAGERPAETLRRLMAGIVDHQKGVLQDDATVVFVTWHGPPPDDIETDDGTPPV